MTETGAGHLTDQGLSRLALPPSWTTVIPTKGEHTMSADTWDENEERRKFREEVKAFRRAVKAQKPSKAPNVLLALAAIMVGAFASLWERPEDQVAEGAPQVALASIGFGPDLSAHIAEFVDWVRVPERSTEEIIDRLDSESLEVRRALVGVALRALESPSAVNQIRALALLERTFPDDPGIDELAYRFALESEREDIRKLAIGMLGRRPTTSNLDRILQAVRDRDRRTPLEVHAALLSLARNPYAPAGSEASKLLDHESPLIVMGAAAVLDSIGKTVGLERLLDLARGSGDLDARLQAMRYLADTHRAVAVDLAIDWLKDPDTPALAISWASKILKEARE